VTRWSLCLTVTLLAIVVVLAIPTRDAADSTDSALATADGLLLQAQDDATLADAQPLIAQASDTASGTLGDLSGVPLILVTRSVGLMAKAATADDASVRLIFLLDARAQIIMARALRGQGPQ